MGDEESVGIIGRIVDLIESMHWALPSAIGVGALFGTIALFAVLDHFWPSQPRRGLFRIETTRGDRLFMSIMLFVGLILTWLAFTPDSSAWYFVAVSAVGSTVIFLFV